MRSKSYGFGKDSFLKVGKARLDKLPLIA